MSNKGYCEIDKFKSKQIVSNISKSLKQLQWKILELDKSKRKTDSLIQKFGIKCYKYNLVEDMSNSKERVENNIRVIIDKLNALTVNPKDISEKTMQKIYYIDDILKSSEVSLKGIDKEQINDIEALQMNAVKKGIYDKFMMLKSSIDRDIIMKKFDKVQNRSSIKKWFDRFFDIEDEIEGRRENLFMQIQEIDRTRARIWDNSMPNKEYRIVDILADIELFLMDNGIQYAKYKMEISQIKELRANINNTFSIDIGALKKAVVEKRQSRLPARVDKNLSKLTKERQKAIEFLNKNGYIVESEQGEQYITQSRMKNIIGRIDYISEGIERILRA